MLFIFWPPLHAVAGTSNVVITPWVRRCLLLVVLSLLGPLPWSGQEWTVIPTSCYGPRGISYTFSLLPSPSLSSSRSWDISEPLVAPLLTSSKEELKHLFSDGLSKRYWGLEIFLSVLHPVPKAVGLTSFSPCPCNRSKFLLSTFSVAFVILHASTVCPYPLHPQHSHFFSEYLLHWLLPCMKFQYTLVFYCPRWTFLQYACCLPFLQFCCILLETGQPKRHQGFMMWGHHAFTQGGSKHCGCVLLNLRSCLLSRPVWIPELMLSEDKLQWDPVLFPK